jgi:hypothetical protein
MPTINSNIVVSGQTVEVRKPQAGQSENVASSPGGVLHFAFDPSTAT